MLLFVMKNIPHITWCQKNYLFLVLCFTSLLNSFFVGLQTSKLSFCSWWCFVYIRNSKLDNSFMNELWCNWWVRKKCDLTGEHRRRLKFYQLSFKILPKFLFISFKIWETVINYWTIKTENWYLFCKMCLLYLENWKLKTIIYI